LEELVNNMIKKRSYLNFAIILISIIMANQGALALIGIPKPDYARSLRHSFATNMIKRTRNIHAIVSTALNELQVG